MPLHGLTPVALEPEPSGLGRLLGRRATENAYRKLHNLVVTTPIRDLTPKTIEGILREYRIELHEARPRLQALYTVVLTAFARDDTLTDAELEDLRRLRDLFGLGAGDVATAGLQVYREALGRAAGDQRVTEDERQRLAALVERLRLPERVVQEAQREILGAIYERVLALIGDSRGPVRHMAGALVAAMCYSACLHATAPHGALAPRRQTHRSPSPKRVLAVATVPGIADQG